ncbi:MAG TPA: hypothetical protein DCS85_01885, partial [Verrucomicrobiales bacterium]|nr:hypothetical protein [Verrucomicrobiales bacterium]
MRRLIPVVILFSVATLAEEERAGLDWWAFQPVVRPLPPSVEGQEELGAIDAFVRARLVKKGMEPARRAERGTLVRRLHFDLTGIPPTTQEIAAFEANESKGAYATLIDTLLSSPHFGERWARHWLDLVRYAETFGHEFDFANQEVWRYRDYV